ncbi:MAG: N-acetyltransferase family protein [Candidatus Hermodarchaeia archaeon]|jgi:RimJ/RimL family protein N-acetyltransferase
MDEKILLELRIVEATETDIPAMTEVMTRSFNDDSQRFRGEPEGGPDGYNDGRFLRKWMDPGYCFKIILGDRIIGAFIIFKDYPQKGSNVLGTIFLDPEYQNLGIGTYAMDYVHQTFPAKHWRLDTPEWHTRNHHFYEKLGYRKVGEQEEPHAGFTLRIYQKDMAKSASSGEGQPFLPCLAI